MPYALKAQITQGDVTAFDCTGGEPADQHRTFAELDPCPDEVMLVCEMTVQDIVDGLFDGFGPETKVADIANWALGQIVPSGLLKDVLPGDTRVQIRKMDSDGHV